jgi:broad specificity phosphatase PhoE
MTTVYFLRHGITEQNKEGRIQGQLPGKISLVGTERYLAAITPLLRDKNPQVLISSDLKRAVETRKMLGNFLQLPNPREAAMPLLREKAMGFYEGMLWSEVPMEFKEQQKKAHYDFRKYGGENEEDVRKRVREALRKIGKEYPNSRVACVTHAGWLRQLGQLDNQEGVLPDGWTNRTAIYEGSLDSEGKLYSFRPIDIEAGVDVEEEE